MFNIIILKNQVIKIFCFILFYIFTLILSFIIFPLLGLIFTGELKLQSVKRKIIRKLFWVFFLPLRLAGVRIYLGDYKKYSNLKSSIIVANHPSLIDIIILMVAIPNIDCVVKKKLFSNFVFKGVVKNLFINAGNTADIIIEKCNISLSNGNNLLIFPEGTRTQVNDIMNNKMKRGAAQIALRTQRDILPIFMKTENYVGLSKNDSVFKVHTKGYSDFTLIYKDIISVNKYNLDNISRSARILTEDIKNKIISEV